MYGVVLWSKPEEGKAVIWCDDHGELAVFVKGEAEAPAMEAGDCVQFEVVPDRRMRRACNPRVVQSEPRADLASLLSVMDLPTDDRRDRTGGKVVSFNHERVRLSGQAGQSAA